MITIFRKIIFFLFLMISLPLAFAGPSEKIDAPIIDDPSKPIMLTPMETKWIPALAMLPSGAEMSILEGDPEKPGPFTIRLKLPANYIIPAHWHPYDEHMTVISGQLNIGLGDTLDLTKGKAHSTGSYVRIPARMHLFAWTTNEETIIQLHGMGPWALLYVDKTPIQSNDEVKEQRIQESGIREG